MGSFIRPTSCMVQCTKRMLCTSINQSILEANPSSKKPKQRKTFKSNAVNRTSSEVKPIYNERLNNEDSYNKGFYNKRSYNEDSSNNKRSYNKRSDNEGSYHERSYDKHSYNVGSHNERTYDKHSYNVGSHNEHRYDKRSYGNNQIFDTGKDLRTSVNMSEMTNNYNGQEDNPSKYRTAFNPKSRTIRKASSALYLRDKDLIIIKKLSNNETIEDKDWIAIHDELKSQERVLEAAIDSIICEFCISMYKQPDQIINYFKFLERNNYNLSLFMLSTYMKVYRIRADFNGKPITAEEEEEICRIYDKIRKEHSILDSTTCTNCITGLTLTKRWKESTELFEMIKISDTPGSTVMKIIISTAFKNNDTEYAFELMKSAIDQLLLHPDVYIDYLDYCKRNFKNDLVEKEVEKLFDFWKEHFVILPMPVVEKYADFYKSIGYDATVTKIKSSGNCIKCNHKLHKEPISKMNFKLLSSVVFKNMIIGSDAYQSTSPEELKKYKIFLQTMKPYDVVVDGLNVAYASKQVTKSGSLDNILRIVNYFSKDKKRILIVGRAHMNWWSKEKMIEIERKADVFLLKNLSQDDPFLIHLTMLSGPDTYFVTRDLLRQHKAKLDDVNLKLLFKKWQICRQYFFSKPDYSPKIILHPPPPYDPHIQKNENGWHIPCIDIQTRTVLPDIYKIENWLCLSKKTKKT